MTKDDICCRLLEQQLLAMEQILKSIKSITSAYGHKEIDSSKLERGIVEILEQIEEEVE